MRKPNVENKYNLTMKDVNNLVSFDRSKITSPLFTRNRLTNTWDITGSTTKKNSDVTSLACNEFLIRVDYDGSIRVMCSTYGGMANYNFNEFFKENEIENELDLEIQEKLLETINMLLDEGILFRGDLA